jgi:hypothetical protein
VSAGLAALLAGLGGAALALAFAELLAAAPAVRNYVESAAGALLRSGRDGSAPTVAERRRLGIVAGLGLSLITLLIAGPWLAAPVAGFGPWLADQALSRGATRYRQRLEEAVPVIARGLAAALASGGTVRRALRDLAPTLEGPASPPYPRGGGPPPTLCARWPSAVARTRSPSSWGPSSRRSVPAATWSAC